MKKIKWFLLCIFILLLLIPPSLIYSLYWVGLEALPENSKPAPVNKFNNLICEVIWIETGGTGPIRMTPIRLKHLWNMFVNMYRSIDYSKINEDMPPSSGISRLVARILLYQRNHPKLRRRWHLYNLVSEIWVSRHWSGLEAICSFAEWGYFGHDTFGLVNASEKYFNKQPNELRLEEIAVIVGLIRAPSRYSPWCNPEQSLKRTNQLLEEIYIERHGKMNLEKLKKLPSTLLPTPVGVCKDGG